MRSWYDTANELHPCSYQTINVTDPVGRAALICADQNEIAREQCIAVKALLVSIFADVITPSQRASRFVQRVELAGAGAYVN